MSGLIGPVDERPGHYYVTLTRGARTILLSGPYGTHEAACDAVHAACCAADDVQPGAWFDHPGTVRLATGVQAGALERVLGADWRTRRAAV